MKRMVMGFGSKPRWLVAVIALELLVFSGCALSPEAKEARFLDMGKKALAKKDYARAILQFQNGIRSKKTDAEPYYQLGLAYIGAGDGNGAVAAFWKAAELDSKRPDVQVKIAELLISTRDKEEVEKAEQRMGDVLRSAPDNADALNALALAEWNLGKLGDAEIHLQRALLNFPKNLQGSVSLAELRMQKGDFNGAEEVLRKAANQQPPVSDAIVGLAEFLVIAKRDSEAEQQFRLALRVNPGSAVALFDLANLLVRSGKLDQAEPFYARLSSLPDQRYRLSHAVFLFDHGKIPQALAEIEKLSAADPKDRIARSLLVQAYWKAARPLDAEKVLARALRENPKDTEALTQRSAIYLGAGKYDEAQFDLNQGLRFKPDSAEVHYLLSRIDRVRRDLLSQTKELSEAVRLKDDFLQARLELAQVLLATKAPRAALDLLNKTPPAQLKTVPAIIQRNWALLGAGDAPGFRKGVADGLALKRVPDLLLQESIVKIQQRDVAGARASIDEALEIDPRDFRALVLMVMTYRVQKQPEKVLPWLQAMAGKHPDSAPVHAVLGDWLLASGNLVQARTAFSVVLQQSPGYVPAAIGLARVAVSEGKLDEARKSLASASASDPSNGTVTFLMGNVESLAGNRAKALELYNKVLEAEPSNPLVLNNVAYLLADFSQKPDEALKYAQRAKELSPDDPGVEDTLGWVLYRKGVYDVALRHLKAAASGGSTAQSEYHLAAAYFKTGDRKGCERALDTALRLNPKLPEALQLQSQLHAAPHATQN
jgi:tetratricopeptide (TPR) repeat protein